MQSFHFIVFTRGDACIAAFVLVITSVISVSDIKGVLVIGPLYQLITLSRKGLVPTSTLHISHD